MNHAETVKERNTRWAVFAIYLAFSLGMSGFYFLQKTPYHPVPQILFLTFLLMGSCLVFFNLRGIVRGRWKTYQDKNRAIARIRAVYSWLAPAISSAAAAVAVTYPQSEVALGIPSVYVGTLALFILVASWVFREEMNDLTKKSFPGFIFHVFMLILVPVVVAVVQSEYFSAESVVSEEAVPSPLIGSSARLFIILVFAGVSSAWGAQKLWEWVEPADNPSQLFLQNLYQSEEKKKLQSMRDKAKGNPSKLYRYWKRKLNHSRYKEDQAKAQRRWDEDLRRNTYRWKEEQELRRRHSQEDRELRDEFRDLAWEKRYGEITPFFVQKDEPA